MANVPQQKLYCVRLMIRGRCCMANVPQQKVVLCTSYDTRTLLYGKSATNKRMYFICFCKC